MQAGNPYRRPVDTISICHLALPVTSAFLKVANILTTMRLVWIIAVGWIAGFTAARSVAAPLEPPIKVSLCEIKAHREKYLKKVVEFTAVASHGFEDSTVEDSRCPFGESNPGVWMEYGGLRSTGTTYCCGPSNKWTRDKPLVIDGIPLTLDEDKEFQMFDARLHPKHSTPQRESNTVKATLRGRVFARFEGIAGTQLSPDWRGYGHMGCCMLFVVNQVVALAPSK
jgi:hypothetical protein